MSMPSGFELILILLVVLLLFGGRKIPELMKGIGTGIKNFKEAVKDDNNQPEAIANINQPINSQQPHQTESKSNSNSQESKV
jgi:sec-independent protein translocase protein TatA